jgi:hypothetical protein
MKPNEFVAFLLGSPFHPILGRTMLIRVTGRKNRTSDQHAGQLRSLQQRALGPDLKR